MVSAFVLFFLSYNKQFIRRRRLQSGPHFKPITYYVDPSVPENLRPSFKAGIEGWDPAFVEAGFPEGSIRAVLPGDPDWPQDYSTEDMRYVRTTSRCQAGRGERLLVQSN